MGSPYQAKVRDRLTEGEVVCCTENLCELGIQVHFYTCSNKGPPIYYVIQDGAEGFPQYITILHGWFDGTGGSCGSCGSVALNGSGRSGGLMSLFGLFGLVDLVCQLVWYSPSSLVTHSEDCL